MERLELDIGIQEYVIPGGGVLRFNPADPALYGRFEKAAEAIKTVEAGILEQAKGAKPEKLLSLMNQADLQIKAMLDEIFGHGNDFHQALAGVSLLTVLPDGKTLAQALFSALGKVLEKGAQSLVDARVAAARKAKPED